MENNNQSLDNSDQNSTSAQKAGEDDWGESSFLGAAVGILVTVVLAAISAIILVLMDMLNRQGKMVDDTEYNPPFSSVSKSVSPPKFSSNASIVIPSTSTSWLPQNTAPIKYNYNTRAQSPWTAAAISLSNLIFKVSGKS